MPSNKPIELGTVINSDGSLHDIEGRGLIRLQRLADHLINQPTFIGPTNQAIDWATEKLRD